MNTKKSATLRFFTLVILLSVYSICIGFIYSTYIPEIYAWGDEYSVIAGSKDSILTWFSDGYSNYFNVYPEFFSPYTDFIRPVANLIYRIFGGALNVQLLVVNYGFLIVLSACIFIASVKLGNDTITACLASAVCFFAPAFWASPAPIHPAFAFDLIAALLCCVAWFFLLSERWFSALGFITVALLTKETAFPCLIALVFLHFLLKKPGAAFLSLMIVAAWFVLRYISFGSFDGTYKTGMVDGFTLAVNIVKLSPFLAIPIESPGTFIRLMLAGDASITNLIILLLNLTIICLLTAAVADRCKSKNFSFFSFKLFLPKVRAASFTIQTYTLLAAIFSAGFLVLFDLEVRFYFIFFVFFLLNVLMLKDTRIKMLTLFSMLFGGLLLFSSTMNDLKKNYNMNEFKFTKSRELVDFLRGLPAAEKSERICVVNDFINGYSSTASLARAKDISLDLWRCNSLEIESCSLSELTEIRVTERQGSVHVFLPSCASFKFYGVGDAMLMKNLDGNQLARNAEINYIFPEISLEKPMNSGQVRIKSFGTTLGMNLREKVRFIYHDFQENEWKISRVPAIRVH